MTVEPHPPLPSQPTPTKAVDVSNGGELCNTLDLAGLADWGPLGTGTEPPETYHHC